MTDQEIIYKAIREVVNTDNPSQFAAHNSTCYAIAKYVCEELREKLNSIHAEQPSEELEKASYHAAMELMNNPNFTPKTILGQFISMLQGLFKDGAQWPARAPHLLPV